MRLLHNIRKAINEFAYLLWHWEHWHWLIKYIPLLPAWFWYCLRARSFWFFTASNPCLTFGGFAGETKSEMYARLPAESFPRTIHISPTIPFSEVARQVLPVFSFPVAVKPDEGRMGLMFRKINSIDELRHYHLRMRYDYLLQEYIDYPIEVSVFYYRFPGQATGTITGFVRKEPLSVLGDGRSSLRELILAYPRVRFRTHEMLLKHEGHLDTIVPRDKTFVLSEAFNLSRGGRLVSLEHEKDERLLGVFDRLSHAADFYYGRYDIRCTSIEDLKEGRNFAVLEFNGSGAEPHHIYGNGNSLFRAMKILVDHWGALYRISRANFERGVSPWSFERGYSFFIKSEEYITRLRQLDMEVNHEGEREEPAGSEATRAGLAPEVVVQGAGSLTKQRANGN